MFLITSNALTLHNALQIMKFATLNGGDSNHSQPCRSSEDFFPSNGFGWFFPHPQQIPHMHAPIRTHLFAGILCTSLEFSTFLLAYLQTLTSLSPWTPGHSQALPQFYIPSSWPRNALHVVSQSNHRAHLASFQSFRDHYSSLLNVQCFENCYSFYFVRVLCCCCFRQKGKSVPCYSNLACIRSHLLF